MTLAEYIEDVIRLKSGEGAEQVCWTQDLRGIPIQRCDYVIDPFAVGTYATILRQEIYHVYQFDSVQADLVEAMEKVLGWMYDEDIAPLLHEIGRIIIARTPVTIYWGEEYLAETSQLLTGWKAEDFGYPDNKPHYLWWYLATFPVRSDYDAFVQLDLLIADIWMISNLPTTLSYTAPREERAWIYEKLGDFFDFLGGIYEAVFTAMFATWWQFTLTVATFYYIIGPALTEAMIPSVATYVSSTGAIVTVTGTTYWSTAAFVTALKAYFGAFLAAIHYSTLVSIHEIAYLVSEDYREMMRGVYSTISEFSEALGYGPYFMALLLRNTRTLVLDASTMMGMKYDMAEIQWLATFEEYSEILSARAYLYKDDPEALFYDLEQLIEQPVVTAAGIFMETVVTTVNNTLVSIESAVVDITAIRDDLDELIADLPEEIRSEITPITDPIIARFDDFIADQYEPTIGTLQTLVNTVSAALDVAKGNLDNVVDRLLRPADYILEIDGMTDEERTEQEDKLSEVTGRGDTRATEEYTGESSEDIDLWETLMEEIETERPEVEWLTPEEGSPSGIPMAEMEPGETWFIGDF